MAVKRIPEEVKDQFGKFLVDCHTHRRCFERGNVKAGPGMDGGEEIAFGLWALGFWPGPKD
jgi:hypothetical protein